MLHVGSPIKSGKKSKISSELKNKPKQKQKKIPDFVEMSECDVN